MNDTGTPPGTPVVLYIAGYGRSGSTVLEMALGNQSCVFAAGELTHLFRELAVGRQCACGTDLRVCAVWSVFDGPRGELEGMDALVRMLERKRLLSSRAHPSRSAHAVYAQTWRQVFDVLAARTHARAIIDSSKTAGAGQRPGLLAGHCGLDVRVIHLVRDPRAVMWSIFRGSNRLLAAGSDAKLRCGAVRALAGWIRCNRAAERQIREAGLPAARVRYEDFIERPAAEIQRIGRELDVDLDEAASALSQQQPLPTGHGVAGNRTRTTGAARLRLDDEWKRMLPWHGNVLAMAAEPLAARYGYDLSE